MMDAFADSIPTPSARSDATPASRPAQSEIGTAPRYLLLKGSGGAGLGDKILALIVASQYARLTDRLLCIDWRDRAYGDGTRNYFGDLFRAIGLPLADGLPTAGSTWPRAWEGRLAVSLDDVVVADGFSWNRAGGRARYSFDQTRLDYAEDVLVMWEMDQYPLVRALYETRFPESKTCTDTQAQAAFFQAHFAVHASIQARVDEFVNQHFTRGPVIGVHVRLTDESEACRRNPTLAAFVGATSRILQEVPDARIFLASDNRSVMDRFRSEFGAERILALDKWFPAPGMHLHKNPQCPDRLQNARDALVDASLLGRCDWLLGSHESAFSRIAALFSLAPPARQRMLFPQVPLGARLRSAARRMLALGTLKRR